MSKASSLVASHATV